MPKQAIAIFYVPGILIVLMAIIVFSSASSDYNYQLSQLSYNLAFYQGFCSVSVEPQCLAVKNIANDSNTMQTSIAFIRLGGLLVIIAWIGALVNLGKAQEWTWFILIFFLGGITLLIYLIAGPRPLRAVNYPQVQQVPTYPQPYYPPGVPLQPPGPWVHQTPQPTSALEILQQRYARGEIDVATFNQIRTQLEASNHPD